MSSNHLQKLGLRSCTAISSFTFFEHNTRMLNHVHGYSKSCCRAMPYVAQHFHRAMSCLYTYLQEFTILSETAVGCSFFVLIDLLRIPPSTLLAGKPYVKLL